MVKKMVNEDFFFPVTLQLFQGAGPSILLVQLALRSWTLKL